jgi:hypothetical protein
MRTKRLLTASLGLLLACAEPGPAMSNDRDIDKDDVTSDDDADEQGPADAGDEAELPSGPRKDGGSSQPAGDGRPKADSGSSVAARDAGTQSGTDGAAARDGATSATADAARPDSGASGGSASSDAGAADASVAPPAGGVLASVRAKKPYSSKSTGAATWLVNADARATQTAIDSDMKAAGSDRFAVFSLYRYAPNSGTNAAGHRAWIVAVAEAIARNGGTCVVVLEPDAFALGAKDRPDVDAVLNTAIGILKDQAPNAALFLDIGHSNWHPASTVLARAKAYSNYAKIDGWASNTSNFQPTSKEEAYARQLYDGSQKPTIIDTSRNGLGRVPSTIFNPPDSEWDPGPPFAFHPNDPAVLFNYYNKPSNERD